MSACRHCSHDRAAHEHYRAGTDCSTCECARYGRSMIPAVMSHLGRRETLVTATPAKADAAA